IMFCSACASAPAPSNPDAAMTALVDSARTMIEAEMQAANLPGLSIAVAVDGQVVWAEGFGHADRETGQPVTPASKFRVGSVSKPFTATAVAQLMSDSRMDVDAPIQTWVPTFPTKEWTISTRQVGGHIAGIRHYEGDENLSAVEYPTVQAGLEIFKDSPLLFEPGTRYAYSSYGWNLISAVVEGASGQDFLTYMDEHVFGPLGMTSTEADWATRDIAERVSFYVRDENGSPVPAPYVDNSYKWAGGGFLSTPADMLRFAEAHRSPGFLSQEALDFLQTSQQLADGSATGYGFGWTTAEDDAGRRLVGHTGGSVGGTTLLTMNPETGIVVAMAINLSGADLSVGRRIMQLFLDGPTPD
ncbi:MAG: serine hydrolase, partial [Bacteroidetes bacterium]|nr:serine hydrolase [Bacteroidota bacterium]